MSRRLKRLRPPPGQKMWWTQRPELMERINGGRYHISHDTVRAPLFGEVHPGLVEGCPICLKLV